MMPFTSAQDHKRAFDGDKGPNTGGMGAYSPAHMMSAELENKILKRLIEPTIAAMAAVIWTGVTVISCPNEMEGRERVVHFFKGLNTPDDSPGRSMPNREPNPKRRM
mgnify:CR=1 FL=1